MHTLSQKNCEKIIKSTVEFLNEKGTEFVQNINSQNVSNLSESKRKELAAKVRDKLSIVRDVNIINGQLVIGLESDPKKTGEINYLQIDSHEWQKTLNPEVKAILKSRKLVGNTLSSEETEESIPLDMAS